MTAFWCLLNNNSYEEAVLAAVNLGGDTDTSACIVGGLAGLVWGFKDNVGIPDNWKKEIYNSEIIDLIINDFSMNLLKKW